MINSLAKSALSVQRALEKHGLQSTVLEYSESTRTAIDAAAAIGCDVGQIVKSLIFKTKDSHLPVLVLASGPNRVNERSIEAKMGEKIVKADAEFVREATGFAIGGIPPIGHKNDIKYIYIDEALLQFSEIWAAAGTPNSVFCIKTTDLLDLTDGEVISIQ